MNGGAKHAASVLEVDIKDRGLLVEIALNHNSPLDVLLVHCWKPPWTRFCQDALLIHIPDDSKVNDLKQD